MTASAPKLATVDDLFAIPEDERRHELIEGVIEPKGAASGRHGASQRKLSGYVSPFDRRPTGGAPGG
jgi:Uma2 family endonuclease